WFLDFRGESGIAFNGQTPIQANYFFTQPVGALSDEAPVSAYVYRPGSSEDPLRFNIGIHGFSTGFRFARDFQIRFGRHRYDQPEYQQLLIAHSYSAQVNYANVTIPLDWLGGEFRYDRRRPEEPVRQLLFSLGGLNGADGTALGMAQGLITLAFAEGREAPRLTLTGYASLRSNPQPETGPIPDPGITHGEGFAATFDYGIFTGGAGFAHRYGSSHNTLELEATDERHVGTLLADFHPGDWRFRGVVSFLGRASARDAAVTPAVAATETHTEFSVGYSPVQGLTFSLGYRGAYGEDGGAPGRDLSTHMGFLGMATNFQGEVPFSGN
ncbi:MAG TPA: hypothetical protein VJR29_06645, partial [bacterium]|nr:hypothetical protein [bacterium]